MKKKILPVLFIICALIPLSCAQIEAAAHKPVISGNYEQGWRMYASEEGAGDDYFFQDAWLKWKQDLSSKSYYYVKLNYHGNNFSTRNSLDSQTVDLLLNFTKQVTKPLRIKTELNLRQKNYPHDATGINDVEKDYTGITGDLEVTLRPWEKDAFFFNVKLQHESYPRSDKDHLLTGVNFRWERKVIKGLEVHTSCNFSREEYYFTDETDKMRYAISLGFEYQL